MNRSVFMAGIISILFVAFSLTGFSNQIRLTSADTNKTDITVESIVNVGTMDSAWPSYSHDNRHSGQSPYATADNPMNVKWKFQPDRMGFDSSPVIDKNAILYIGCMDHYLYAINPDGSERWRYNIND